MKYELYLVELCTLSAGRPAGWTTHNDNDSDNNRSGRHRSALCVIQNAVSASDISIKRRLFPLGSFASSVPVHQ